MKNLISLEKKDTLDIECIGDGVIHVQILMFHKVDVMTKGHHEKVILI